VSALAGGRQTVNYEGQAAVEFEALADSSQESYPFSIEMNCVQVRDVLAAIIQDVRMDIPRSRISARFHNGLAESVLNVVKKISRESDLQSVVLSGGVWQNVTLLRKTLALLRNNGFRVYIHREVPTNDGGLSLGQAAISAARLRG